MNNSEIHPDVLKLLNDVDTAFEVIRISWDKPTPQAVSAINEPWEKIREILEAHHAAKREEHNAMKK